MSLDQLVARLETATSKLEALAGVAPGAGGAPSASSEAGGEALAAFDEILNGPVKQFVDIAQKIGGEIQQQSEIFHKAFKAQRDFIAIVTKSKKPADNVVQELLKPTSDLISQAQDFREKHRAKKEAFNHLSAISEGIPGLGWVMVAPKPGPYVVQMKEAAEFYTNRVLKEGDDVNKSWARAFPAIFVELGNFVKKYHTTGLVWNPKGGEATAASASAPAPSAGGPPPPPPGGAPPPPPPVDLGKPEPARPDPSQLFAAINKGSDITAGLKKVDKSQMTHKNPELRATSVVPAAAPKEEKEKPAAAGAPADKPPKFALEGNKWCVEYQKNQSSLTLEGAETKHTVYLYKNTNSTLIIKGKVNQITLDSCKKMALVVDNVISSVDVVNSNSCQIQIIGKAPTISVDKTDGVQIYLSKDGLETEIMTSKSSEMNILIPGPKEDSDMVETPVPEQFKSVYKNGKWVTTIVEHSG
jgi:adenylyl cyclase-associated protein